ncbi:MAG TPA: FHA domain-containing protein [Leptolyngbyaceae cyanobacterium M33_DOE_097]|uniref:FHA domain-containing protein n=1 Tax=Oscillatoriales cyanobacterium SpSt-418 TaxID=2282169 RepID=A0A7C3PF08_9CYAN|nr:FHA domain-containing protein [Leptolyngbyaceae cyanobacterium M33_DOE_097]
MLDTNKLNALNLRTLRFLSQNPKLTHLLIKDFGSDMSRVETIINPVLDAPKRCEVSSFYVQAVTTGRTAFLVTNLPDGCATHVTDTSAGWLIGRDSTCAICLADSSISRLHAAIGHRPGEGFYITDVGSTNGTRVNGRKLAPQKPRPIEDGDLLEFSNLRIEFFVAGHLSMVTEFQDTFSGVA